MTTQNLASCDLSEKVLYSSFLLLMGLGYLMGLVYLYTSHQNHDGKPGVSIEDIAENYYGNRSGTRLEAAIPGGMAGFIQPEERHHIIAWLKSGASLDDFLRGDVGLAASLRGHTSGETFITHGEPAAADALRLRIQEQLGWRSQVPEYRQKVTLE